MWLLFPASPLLALFYMFLMALLIVVVFVDAELMLIPLSVTWLGTALGFVGGAFLQTHLRAEGWVDGLTASAIGFAAGFGGLWAVVLLGKLAFGKKNMEFPSLVEWSLREPNEEEGEFEELSFIIDGEVYGWSDLFYRESDRLIIEGEKFRVDGKNVPSRGIRSLALLERR